MVAYVFFYFNYVHTFSLLNYRFHDLIVLCLPFLVNTDYQFLGFIPLLSYDVDRLGELLLELDLCGHFCLQLCNLAGLDFYLQHLLHRLRHDRLDFFQLVTMHLSHPPKAVH